MNSLFNFLLNASAGIVLFYLVYWFFLRKETFHVANRIFLMATLLASVIFPLFPVHYTVLIEAEKSTNVLQVLDGPFKNAEPATIRQETAGESFNWKFAAFLIYFTGAAIFLFRLLFQTIMLILLILKSKIKTTGGIRILENEKYRLPFSFFNFVFINPKYHKQEDLPAILAHEKVHIRERHWFDLVIAELLTVIFWFNPFIWLFERSIKQIHEYLADRSVLASGHKPGRYQALLVNQLMGMQVIGVTNNLNFALNTNRLKMMTKKRTSASRRIKFAWALPALALLLLTCAEPSYEAKEEKSGVMNSPVSENQRDNIIQGTILNNETQQPLHGATVVIKGTTIGTVADSEGRFILTDPNPKMDENTGSTYSEIVVSFVGFKSEVKKVSGTENSEGKNNLIFNMERALILIGMGEVKEAKSPPPPPPVKELSAETPANTEEIFFVVEDMPQYPGGHSALVKYVTEMKEKYAGEKNIGGYVRVGFTVDERGKVTNIRFLPIFEIKPTEEEKEELNFVKATGYGDKDAQKAATQIVSNMKDWKPGSQRGKPVPVDFVIPIKF